MTTTGAALALLEAVWRSISTWPWAMVSAFFSACALGVVVYVNFVKPRRRRKALKNPCDVYFLITSADRRVLGYVSQDADEHLTTKMVVPSDSVWVIELLMRPRMHFKETEIIIGFDGGRDRSNRPKIKKYLNRFIEWGKGKEDTPDINEQHYVDHHGHYHIRRDYTYSLGTDRTVGLEIETKKPEQFSFIVAFVGDEVEGPARLLIHVEQSPCSEVKCEIPDHENCYITFDPAA